MGENNDNNIQAGNNITSTATDQNTITNTALQDHTSDSEDTLHNMASQDHYNSTVNTEGTTVTKPKPKVGYVVAPYTKGLSESLKKYVVSMGYKHTSRATLQSSKHS